MDTNIKTQASVREERTGGERGSNGLLLVGGAAGLGLLGWLFLKNKKINNPFNGQDIRDELAGQTAIEFDNTVDTIAEIRQNYVYSEQFMGVSVLDKNESSIRHTTWQIYALQNIIGTNYENIKSQLPEYNKNDTKHYTKVLAPVHDHMLNELVQEVILRNGYPFDENKVANTICNRSGVYSSIVGNLSTPLIKIAENKTLGEVYMAAILGKDAQWNAKDITMNLVLQPPMSYFTVTRKEAINRTGYAKSQYGKNAFSFIPSYNDDSKSEVYFGNVDKWACSVAFGYSKAKITSTARTKYNENAKGFLQYWIVKDTNLGSDSIKAIKSYCKEKQALDLKLFCIMAPTSAQGDSQFARDYASTWETYINKIFKTTIKASNAAEEAASMKSALDTLVNSIQDYYANNRSVCFEGRAVFTASVKSLLFGLVEGSIPRSLIAGNAWSAFRSIVEFVEAQKRLFLTDTEVYYTSDHDASEIAITDLVSLGDVVLSTLKDYKKQKCSIKVKGKTITSNQVADLCKMATLLNSNKYQNFKNVLVWCSSKQSEDQLKTYCSVSSKSSEVLKNFNWTAIGSFYSDNNSVEDAQAAASTIVSQLTGIAASSARNLGVTLRNASSLAEWKLTHATAVAGEPVLGHSVLR